MSAHDPSVDAATSSDAPQRAESTAEVDLDGEITTIAWPAHTRLLDAMLDAGLDAPHSCTQGQCGACQCHIETDDGATHMVENYVLDDYDIKDGYRLACQTEWTTPGNFEVTYPF